MRLPLSVTSFPRRHAWFVRSLDLPRTFCAGKSLSPKKKAPGLQNVPAATAAADFQTFRPSVDQNNLEQNFQPLTTKNFVEPAKLPPKIVLEGEIKCNGPVNLEVQGRADSNLDWNLGAKVDANFECKGLAKVQCGAGANLDSSLGANFGAKLDAEIKHKDLGKVHGRADANLDSSSGAKVNGEIDVEVNGLGKGHIALPDGNAQWDFELARMEVPFGKAGSIDFIAYDNGCLKCEMDTPMASGGVRTEGSEIEANFTLPGMSAGFHQSENETGGHLTLPGTISADFHQTENETGGNLTVPGFSADFHQTANETAGKMNVMGCVASGEQKSFDVSSREEKSIFEHDKNGKLKHYYGEKEEVTGTEEASYLGVGRGLVPGGGIEASGQVKFNVHNQENLTRHKETHEFSQRDDRQKDVHTTVDSEDHSSLGTFSSNKDVKVCKHQHAKDVMDDKVIESKITTDTHDTSQSAFGMKYGGEEVTKTHTETTTTSTEKGFFTNKVQTEKVTEDLEYKQQHSLLDSEIEILTDNKEVENELEYVLNEAGCGALVILVKPAVKLHKQYMDTGTLTSAKVVKAIGETGVGLAGIALLTRIGGPDNVAVTAVMLATLIPKICRGDREGAMQDVERFVTSVISARIASCCVSWLLHAAGCSPVAAIGGTAAGILTSSVVATHRFDMDHFFEKLREERNRRHRLKLAI